MALTQWILVLFVGVVLVAGFSAVYFAVTFVGFGPSTVAVLLILATIIFGRRLPELGRILGQKIGSWTRW